jgi:hypothetical protein
MNDPDFKPRPLPPLPSVVRPIFVGLAALATLLALGVLVYAFVGAPHGVTPAAP